MKVIVELGDGDEDVAAATVMLGLGDKQPMDDPHYWIRIVSVVDDDGDDLHCRGCGNDDGPSWCRGADPDRHARR